MVVFLMGGVLISACSEQQKLNYKEKILNHRFEKNRHFKYADNSPIPDDEQTSFKALNYYPVDTKYRVVAKIKKQVKRDTFQMAYTNGESKTYFTYARLDFRLNGRSNSLYTYKNIDKQNKGANSLFIPFYDKTNGRTTYAGGRYIDVTKLEGDTTMLDFNQAYNPYCVYNKEYTCPIPPEANRLKIAVKAGEKQFEGD